MPWSELSFLQWVGLVAGYVGVTVLGWALVVSNGFGKDVQRTILTIHREKDDQKAAETARAVGDDVSSLHWAIALALAAFALHFGIYQLELTR